MSNEQLIAKLSVLPKNYKITRGFTEDEMDEEEPLDDSVAVRTIYSSDKRKEIRLI